MIDRHLDSAGLAFEALRSTLPPRCDWPKRAAVKAPRLLRECHAEMSECLSCGSVVRSTLELHHLVGGRGGRSDERTNLVALCRVCHGLVNTPALPFGRLLWLKWLHQPEEVSWERLTLLHGRWLPELVTG